MPALALALLFFTGCSGAAPSSDSATETVYAMDTVMTITAYGENSEAAVAAAAEKIEELDELLDSSDEESEIYAVNEAGSGVLSYDAARIVMTALNAYELTGGAFDITIYPVMLAWGFTTEEYNVPSDSEIEALLENVGSDKLSLEANEDGTAQITLAEGQGIDLGGVAKGYVSALIMDIFEEYGIESGIVSLGGNVQCLGAKTDGSAWRCGIANPDDPENTNNLLGVIEVSDCAVITSGSYMRYFTDEETGLTYHHIIDPATGYPADSGLTSVTIVSADGALADALSTACYVMGPDEAVSFWRSGAAQFDMILVAKDGSICVTEGIASDFTSDYDFEIIYEED